MGARRFEGALLSILVIASLMVPLLPLNIPQVKASKYVSEFYIPYVQVPNIIVDGQRIEAIWDQAAHIHDWSTHIKTIEFNVYLLQDDAYLYILAEIHGNDFAVRDKLEIEINDRNDGRYGGGSGNDIKRIQVTDIRSGTYLDRYIPLGVYGEVTDSHKDGEGAFTFSTVRSIGVIGDYCFELKIPLDSGDPQDAKLGENPFGMNIAFTDYDPVEGVGYGYWLVRGSFVLSAPPVAPTYENIILGKDTAYNVDLTGDAPWVWYEKGDLPPIMAAKRVGSGAVVAAGTARTGNGGITYPTLRWKVGEWDVLLDKTFQWMVPGGTKILWYGKYEVGYNVFNDAARSSWLIDNLRAKGYTVENHGLTPITSSMLEPYDILVIPQLQIGDRYTGGDPSLLPDADVQAIKSFVEGGGGLLIMEGSDFAGYNYYKVQNKILRALDMGIYFQMDSVYDDINNWENNYWPVVDVNPGSEIGAAYQAATGKTTVTLYAINSLAPRPRIPVPYYSQGQAMWCLPASMAMIMKYYGKSIHLYDIVDDFKLARNGRKFEIGFPLFPSDVDLYFLSHGLGVEALRFALPPYKVDLDVIKNWINNGWPVILGIGAIDHAVVLIGYYDVSNDTIFYVNDPSGALLLRIPGRTYELPYIAEEVPWSNIQNIIGTGSWWEYNWALAVRGAPSPPLGTIDVVDYSVEVAHKFDTVVRRGVYSWLRGYNWLGMGRGLDWNHTEDHPLSLDPKDFLDFGLIIKNHTDGEQDYQFEVRFSRDGVWVWSRSYALSVEEYSDRVPITEKLWIKNLFEQEGKYTLTLRLWDKDHSTLYDEVIFPKIKYTKTLSLSLHSAASFYVIDPQGQRIGINPETGQIINEIPGAVYTALENEPQFIIIPDPLIGIYDSKLLGTATGTYTLDIELAVPSGTIVQTYIGDIVQGQILTCTINVSENDATSSEPIRVPPSVLVNKLNMAQYIKLELLWLNTTVNNMEIKQDVKEGLKDKLNNATKKIDQAINWIELSNEGEANNMLNAAGNIMNAFINQVNAQKGKAIVASDANSLITNAQNIILDIENAKKI